MQTLQPDHFSLACASRHDFRSFASAELASRRELGYPPFSRLILLRVEGESLSSVEQTAGELATSLRLSAEGRLAILGPTPAPLERLRGRHRFLILLRGQSGRTVRGIAASTVEKSMPQARRRGVRLLVDVDPYDML